MNKKISILAVLLVMVASLTACNKEEAATVAKPAGDSAVAVVANPAAVSKDAVIELGAIGDDGMPTLARKSNCAACHLVDGKKLGPSWVEVARKYKGVGSYKFAGKDYPLEEGMFLKIAKGGAGVWGTMPMPANSPAVKDEEIRLLVKFILGMSK